MVDNEQYAEMYLKQEIARLLGLFPDHKLRAKDPIYTFLSNYVISRLEEEKKLLSIDLSISFTKECMSRNTFCI